MNSNLQTLRKLKLYGMAAHLEACLAMAPHQRPDQDILLAQLIEAEDLYRTHRKTTLSIKNARFRYQANIQQIICSADRNLSKQQLNYYLDGAFIDRAENIIITGATGCGKSYLASAIGHHVCTLGKKVAYHSLPKLLQKLKSDRIDGSFRKELEKIENKHLLILDDWGIAPLDMAARLALLQIIEDRQGRYSTIITAQLPVAEWHSYINESTIADAILDRIIHQAHRIELTGESLRKTLKNQTL